MNQRYRHHFVETAAASVFATHQASEKLGYQGHPGGQVGRLSPAAIGNSSEERRNEFVIARAGWRFASLPGTNQGFDCMTG